ncbi:MAG: 4'-phosphopantetheinyl transferase superfamily protein [Bacteroidales bacterium]|nr:4'-phosphopantetheinyl transferase superfamily protein [Bacteroidales bacterium]
MEIIHQNDIIIVFSEIIQDEKLLSDYIKADELIKKLNNIKNVKRRLEILNSHYLIYKILGNYFIYTYDDQNKPFIPGVGKISITHTDNYISLIFGFDKRVGIDMEENDRDFSKAAQKFLHPYEKTWALINDHYKAIWCAKESCYKMIDKPKFSFSKYYITKKIDFNKDNNIYVEIIEPKNQIVSLCFFKNHKFFLTWCVDEI